MNLRPAGPKDAGRMALILVSSWRAAYRGVVPDPYLAKLDVRRQSERMKMFLESVEAETFAIEGESETVGFVTIGPGRDADSLTGELWGIYLAPEHWRKGIGTAVLREIEPMLVARGFTTAILWVFAGNGSARGFYGGDEVPCGWCNEEPRSRRTLPGDPDVQVPGSLNRPCRP